MASSFYNYFNYPNFAGANLCGYHGNGMSGRLQTQGYLIANVFSVVVLKQYVSKRVTSLPMTDTLLSKIKVHSCVKNAESPCRLQYDYYCLSTSQPDSKTYDIFCINI